MHDKISIIVPAYQHAKSLPVCLESIYTQTYAHIEVIVVNDGSTDETEQVLEPYAKRDDTIVIHQENAGANPARMRGFDAASGTYVIFCDADVVMQPEMLTRLYGALQEHPEASFAYSGFRFGWKRFSPVEFDRELLFRRNYIHTTSLVRKKDFPGFDPSISRLQDWDVWLTMVEEGKVGVVIPEQLFTVRTDGKSRIGTAWLPSFVYTFPWKFIGWKPKRLRLYERARKELTKKHPNIHSIG